MKPKKHIKGKKSFGKRNILNKKQKNKQQKQHNESLNKGQKNAKFVQRVRQMQEEHRKQKRIEDKYRAEASASMLDTYFQTDELIQQALTEAPKDQTYDELLNVLKVDKPNTAMESEDSDEEEMEEEEEVEEEEEMLEEQQDEALYSSDEETEQKETTGKDIEFVETAVEQDIESEDDDAEEDDDQTKCHNKDPFAKHVDYELTPEHLEQLLSQPTQQKFTHTWPQLGKFDLEASTDLLPKMPEIPCNLQQMSVNSNLRENCNLPLTALESELFSVVNNYLDVYYSKRTHEVASELRQVYCLHALNHLKKTRNRVLRHNAKLLAAAKEAEKLRKNKKKSKLAQKPKIEAGIVPDNYRDQGFVRPKVLIMLPTRDAAYQVVNKLATLSFGETVIQKTQKNTKLMNYERFLEAYTGNTLHFPKVKPKPEDYEQTFAGNTDDNFRLGLTLTKRNLRLFTDFYASDILIASPLGLRTIIGAAGSEQRDYDFLNSIELLIIDQADMLYAQNWENVLHVMDHLHLQPQSLERTSDFQRVRPWYINGWARFYRQTLLFATHQLPEFKALLNNKCSNYEGRVFINSELNDIRNVVVNIPQVFERFSCPTLQDLGDKRFDFFITQILPRFKQTSFAHCLIYIPSYFDYVRLRNYFREEHISCVQICEYTKQEKIARARDIFYHSGAHFMLYAERAHYFRRTRIKGIRHLIMYAPPAFPHFYSELINLMQNSNQNARDGLQDNMSITVLYTQYDGLQLSNILGTENTGLLENPTCATTTPETLAALLWTTTAVFGIVYAFLGYRCLRAVGFVSGMLVGANGVFLLQNMQVTLLGQPTDSVLAIVAGLLGALLGSTYPVASVLISAFAGALLSGAAMTVCVATMPQNEFGQREIYVAVAGGAIICAVLTLCCVKYVTILTSSIVGTAMILVSIDFFLHGLATVNWILSIQPHPVPPPCYGGILICAWPVSVVVSIMVQSFITAWRIDHRKQRIYRRHPQAMPLPVGEGRTRETREEARQRKFRYLYQVRSARGDIISQNFVSALQKRIQFGGAETPSERSLKTSSNERNTFRSDRTHFTNIPDSSEMCDKIEIVPDMG